jgi:hypothetical protein
MSIWSNVTYTLESAAGDISSAAINGLVKRVLSDKDSTIHYNTRKGYKNVLLFTAKREVMAETMQAIKNIIPNKVRAIEETNRKKVEAQQAAIYSQIISDGEIVDMEYGFVKTKEGKYIYAVDPYGKKVSDALMLYYDSDKQILHQQKVIGSGGSSSSTVDESFYTSTVCHIDINAKLSVQSDNNLILTPVQGRNFSRKERVSGGDYVFQVRGEINSNEQGVYPDQLVKKFVQIMEYEGIVNVNFILFNNINVTRILIKNWNLGEVECKNIQPYTFNCVAVEQDEEISISSDTINVIDYSVLTSSTDSWYKLILQDKMAQIATMAAESVAAKALDELAPNI